MPSHRSRRWGPDHCPWPGGPGWETVLALPPRASSLWATGTLWGSNERIWSGGGGRGNRQRQWWPAGGPSPGGGGSAHTWTRGPARGSAGLPGPVGHVSAQPGLDRRTRRVPEPLGRESHMSPKRRRENNFEEWKRNPTCPKAWGSCSEGICGVGVGQGGGHRRSTAQASAFGLGENEAT